MSENNNSDNINRDELNLQRKILYETILHFEIPRLSVLLLTIPFGLIMSLLFQISDYIINLRDKLLEYIVE